VCTPRDQLLEIGDELLDRHGGLEIFGRTIVGAAPADASDIPVRRAKELAAAIVRQW